MATEILRCECGKRRSRWSQRCRACTQTAIDRARTETRKVVETGQCPRCGTGLVRNLALAGWWQCGGYASEGFRRPGFENVPSCSWQGFTE